MISDDLDAFVAQASRLPAIGPATARGVFLVAPDGMRLAEQSAADNAYMDLSVAFDVEIGRASCRERVLLRV